jgi:Ser/Thr protein kinase RdoA (MazF antagonist)
VIEHLSRLVGSPFTVEELKRKPGRRCTLRVTGTRRAAIVKVYESDRALVVAARLEALAAGPSEPCVPEVLHVDPGRRTIVLSEVPGAPLRESILAGDVGTCARVGRVLSSWHRAWRGRRPDSLRSHTVEEERRTVLARAEDGPSSLAPAVRSALPSLVREWPCTTVVHRDLYEEQVILGDYVGLIDLDDAALGPPELDVGNLLAHIELLELRSGARYAAPVEAILDGYGFSSLDREVLDRCRRLSLLRLACIHGMPELIGRAQKAREEVPA